VAQLRQGGETKRATVRSTQKHQGGLLGQVKKKGGGGCTKKKRAEIWETWTTCARQWDSPGPSQEGKSRPGKRFGRATTHLSSTWIRPINPCPQKGEDVRGPSPRPGGRATTARGRDEGKVRARKIWLLPHLLVLDFFQQRGSKSRSL